MVISSILDYNDDDNNNIFKYAAIAVESAQDYL